MRTLSLRPSPEVPCITFLGTDEAIVDSDRIYERMGRWPNGQLKLIENGRHEILMERAPLRERVLDDMIGLFDSFSA